MGLKTGQMMIELQSVKSVTKFYLTIDVNAGGFLF